MSSRLRLDFDDCKRVSVAQVSRIQWVCRMLQWRILAMGLAPSLYEEISYDESGNCLGGSFVDYLVPTAVESPHWETGHTVTPSPHHPIGAKGAGEAGCVGAMPAVANALVDALSDYGIQHIEMPATAERETHSDSVPLTLRYWSQFIRRSPSVSAAVSWVTPLWS